MKFIYKTGTLLSMIKNTILLLFTDGWINFLMPQRGAMEDDCGQINHP